MIEFLTMPKIFWFTGQAGAGKTELANMLKTRLIREQTIIQQNYSMHKVPSGHTPNKKFVIIDGDHRGEACIQYIEQVLPYTSSDTVIVLDDIYWSPSMTEAWKVCIADARFTLSLDFFDFGVLYQTKGRVKEHFVLKQPWK